MTEVISVCRNWGGNEAVNLLFAVFLVNFKPADNDAIIVNGLCNRGFCAGNPDQVKLALWSA